MDEFRKGTREAPMVYKRNNPVSWDGYLEV